MGYVLSNGLYYIARINGMYQPVAKQSMAHVWPDETSAKNVAKCMLSTALRKQNYLPKVLVPEPAASATTPAVRKPEEKKPSVRHCPPRLGHTGIPDADQMYLRFSAMANTFSSLLDMRSACSAALQNENLIQEDLLHKIEFMSGGKGQAAKAWSQLHACRIRRRVWKELLDVLDGAAGKTTPEAWNGYIQSKEAEISSRSYTPRTKEVF